MMNQEEIKKSLSDLIDETLNELEDLKKSKFSAAEIELKGPGEGLAGKPSNGDLDAKKSDDKDEDDKKKEEDEAKKKAELEKGVLDAAEVKKSDDEDEDEEEEEEEEEGKKKNPFEKSLAKQNDLMKSMIDSRIKPIEDKMSSLLEIVNKMANMPVTAKGIDYRTVAPLAKSADYIEPLTKTQVLDKLFELKKSGVKVLTEDITGIEVGQDINSIVKKYNLN